MAKAKKPNAKDVQLSARTDAQTKARLRALADQGYSESEIIDAAVKAYLDERDREAAEHAAQYQAEQEQADWAEGRWDKVRPIR